MNINLLVKQVFPPVIVNLLRYFKSRKYGWHGNYDSWGEVEKHTVGYDSSLILEKVRDSLLKVKFGKAVCERDSVLFDEVQYSWPLLSGLMYVAARSKGNLKVLDFGGSLGSTYFQNKKFLDGIFNLSWSIVEQCRFVDIGRADFEDDKLKFFFKVEDCLKQQKPNVLLLSSVLQYIERPYELLDRLLSYELDYIIIDRTPFSFDYNHKIKLQIVPPSIYKASYPCHFFDRVKFLRIFEKYDYRLLDKFEALDGKKVGDYFFEGFIFQRFKRS